MSKTVFHNLDPAMEATDPLAARVVFYDGACPVCRREIGWYGAMRGAEAVDWRDVADPETPLPAGLDRAALLKRFTIRRGTGEIVSGAAAFSALWRALGPTRLLGRVTDRQPFRLVGEALYRLFLRIRLIWR